MRTRRSIHGAAAIILVALVACTSAADGTFPSTILQGTPMAGEPVEGSAASANPSLLPAPSKTPNPTPPPTVLPPLSDDPKQLMSAALTRTFKLRDATAVKRMGDSGNQAYIPVLTELLRFRRYMTVETHEAVFVSLGRLIGMESGRLTQAQRDWDWWVRWVGNHPEAEPPQGYAAWKGEMLTTLVNRATGAFLYDDAPARIRLEEIVWGGVSRDGIPDLTNPPSVAPAKANYLFPQDRVFGVSINGQHRAYPLRILNPHEMANDVLGGVPFALAY